MTGVFSEPSLTCKQHLPALQALPSPPPSGHSRHTCGRAEFITCRRQRTAPGLFPPLPDLSLILFYYSLFFYFIVKCILVNLFHTGSLLISLEQQLQHFSLYPWSKAIKEVFLFNDIFTGSCDLPLVGAQETFVA